MADLIDDPELEALGQLAEEFLAPGDWETSRQSPITQSSIPSWPTESGPCSRP